MNRADVVEILLKRSHRNLNMKIDGDLGYAIIIACFLGYDRIVDMLLAAELPVDVNVVGELGSALAVACARRATDMVRKLLRKGARAKEPKGKLGSPLVVACLQRCEGIVEELLRCESTNINDMGVGGLTPLCAAVKSSNHKIVQMLLKHGADPNKRGGNEMGNLTPLEMCREQGNYPEVVEALKRAGAHDLEISAELKRWRSEEARRAEEGVRKRVQEELKMYRNVPVGGKVGLRDKPEIDRVFKEATRCNAGYDWLRTNDGWRCSGGGHFLTNEQFDILSEGG